MDFEKKILEIFAEKTFYLLRIPEINNEEKKRKRKVFGNEENEVFEDRGLFFLLWILGIEDEDWKKEKFLGSGMGIFRIPGIVSW